jgi:subtilisin family serine protease
VSVRRLLLLCLAALFGAAGPPADAQQVRIDPLLRDVLEAPARDIEAMIVAPMVVLERPQPPLPDRLRPPPRRAPLVALDAEGPGGTARVGVLLRSERPAAVVAQLEALDAEVGAVAGRVITARVPVAALPALERIEGLMSAHAATVATVDHDSSMLDVRAHEVRSVAAGVWTGLTGQGVLVGVYDTGLDLQHPDFFDPQGTTRVAGLWDQTRSGTPPSGFGYGDFCDRGRIQAGGCPQRDVDGHGTHVAGSAAGSGQGAAGARYAGVAPAAELVIVNGGPGTFGIDQVIEGLVWMRDFAAARGQPIVINLSLGSTSGPRDGTHPFEEAVDAVSGNGVIVVTSAGNSGANPSAPTMDSPRIHGQRSLVQGETQSLTFDIPDATAVTGPCRDINFTLLEGWYDGRDRLDVRVVRPDGTGVTAPFGTQRLDHSPNGRILIFNADDGADPGNQDYQVFVLIDSCGESGLPQPGTWRMQVTATQVASDVPFHLWIAQSRFNAPDPQPGWAVGRAGFTNSHNLSTPAAAAQAITVAAHVTRHCFPSAEATTGTACTSTAFREQQGDIATFSSAGPTRDGRVKPEVSAPGRWIVSARSQDANVPNILLHPNGRYWALQGTSMAAPHVTGAIAILLEMDPSLTPDEVRTFLRDGARQDAFTERSYVTGDPGGTPNFQWGWGKLDVAGAVEALGIVAQLPTLVVNAEQLPAPTDVVSRRGARLPLVRLSLTVDGDAPLRVTSLAFQARGNDPGASVVLIAADGSEVGRAPAPLTPGEDRVVIVSDDPGDAERSLDVVVNPGETVVLDAAIELSGAVPNLATFQLEFLAAATRAQTVDEGRAALVRSETGPVTSPVVRTTVLEPDEVFALSANPVHGSELILNFRRRPAAAAIYTVSGRRVVDLLPQIGGAGGRVVWDLTNEQGAPVAPGIFLLHVEVDGETILERLFITRRDGE